ncbi:MAG: hypothetical protein GX428_01485 [Candidatus Atribacteria bacterium]|nr:hypothetical protein [Candidatus Atribacteria bacterium]
MVTELCQRYGNKGRRSPMFRSYPHRLLDKTGHGFRFRDPGWGEVKWKKVMSALLSVGYNYVLSFEHEDPVMSGEDGCEKAVEFLKPLIIK